MVVMMACILKLHNSSSNSLDQVLENWETSLRNISSQFKMLPPAEGDSWDKSLAEFWAQLAAAAKALSQVGTKPNPVRYVPNHPVLLS